MKKYFMVVLDKGIKNIVQTLIRENLMNAYIEEYDSTKCINQIDSNNCVLLLNNKEYSEPLNKQPIKTESKLNCETQYLTVPQVAKKINQSMTFVNSNLRYGFLKGYQITKQGRWKILQEDLDEFIKNKEYTEKKRIQHLNLSLTDTSKILRCGRSTLHKLIENKKIFPDSYDPIRFTKEEVNRYLSTLNPYHGD